MAYKKPKLILRNEVYDNLQSYFGRILNSSHVYQNCLNCKHWAYGKDQCGKFNSKPPAEVIIHSCEAYEDVMEIPF